MHRRASATHGQPVTRLRAGRSIRSLVHAAFASALVLLLAGCSLPKIIILHDPLTVEEHLRLAGIYESEGEIKQARDQYQLALERGKKNAAAWMLYGDFSFRQQDYDTATESYRKEIDLQPQNGDGYNNLAWVFVRRKEKLEKARDLVTKALSLTPEHKPYYLDTLGMVLLGLGDTPGAIAALNESASTLPGDQPLARAEAYDHLAQAYAAAGNGEESRRAQAAADELRRPQQPAPPSPLQAH